MNCSRCGRALESRSFETEGGYRSTVTMRSLLECPSCRLAVVLGALVHLDDAGPPVSLSRTPLVRKDVTARWPCPTCGLALRALTLAWASDALAVESCSTCDLVIVDRDELERIEGMLGDSSDLQRSDLSAVAAATRISDDEVGALERPIRRFLRSIRLL